MCVIMAIERIFPNLKLLELAEKENGDGGGIAWIQDGLVHWEKGLKAKEIHKIGKETKGPWIVHFRWASSGATVPGLTHPFPITSKAGTHIKGTANSVLFHNGTLEDSQKNDLMFMALSRHTSKIPEGNWSDSRVLAYAYYHLGEAILQFIEWDQRVAVLDKDHGIKMYGWWHTLNNSNLRLSSPIRALEKKKEEKKDSKTSNTVIVSNTSKQRIQQWASENNYVENSEGKWIKNGSDPEFELVDGIFRPKKETKLIECKSENVSTFPGC